MSELDLVEWAVEEARNRGASYAEARYENQRQEQFLLKNGILDVLFNGNDRGMGVRVLYDGALGFAAGNDVTKDGTRTLVEDAIAIAKSGRRKHKIVFTEEPAVEAKWKVPEKKPLLETPVEEKLEAFNQLDREVMDLGLNLPARIFQWSGTGIDKYFVNSDGAKIHSYSPRARMLYFLTVAHNGDVEQGSRSMGYGGGWEAFAEWDTLNRVLDEARSLQKSLEEGKKSPEGKMDLVAGPQVAGIASHESCGHPTEADRILGREASQAGKSFITPDSIGDRVGSDVVTVVDDPTVPNTIAYYEYDDEGVKARRRFLYKDGLINEFLQNRETASVLGTRSNGAARAVNYNVEAIVRMANTFVEPQDWAVEEMIEGVKNGIYMKTFTEWNIDDKRYNGKYVGREAYRIENGEIGAPVRNTVVELTTPAWWSAVDAVGKDLEFEAGLCGKSDPTQSLDAMMGGPTIRLRDVYLR
ncbi:MAG: TldD/PmbA family protein [Candidatus Thermoplasmatota archaeon]|nr:TldD/PmbA family protein [Candidatus Thermoplasmatota archaeon]